MNFPHLSGGGEDPSPPRRELNLQGPRPTPLKVRKDSYKIKKPPLPAPPPARLTAADTAHLRREPVIIYAVSPKIIHADVNEFMTVVQRLTGPSLFSEDFYSAGDISPAARLASIEKASPSEREREREKERERASDEVMSMVVEEGVEMSQIPGILSPAPSSLPSLWAGFFSPGSETHGGGFPMLNDLSPFLQGTSFFMPSPSTLFSVSNNIISPTLPYDLFNHGDF